jgi:hypothetical protein
MKHLGIGLLSWPRYERMSSRYGLVALFGEGDQALPWDIDVKTLEEQRGSLIAVLDGQDVDLGTGTLFTETEDGITFIGLKPDDERKEEWLNVDNLYKVDGYLIHKEIELYFHPGN